MDLREAERLRMERRMDLRLGEAERRLGEADLRLGEAERRLGDLERATRVAIFYYKQKNKKIFFYFFLRLQLNRCFGSIFSKK
jgi:hypothetical protein